MIRLFFTSTLLAAALTTHGAIAAPMGKPNSTASSHKNKLVHLSLRNDLPTSVTLDAGGTEVTLAPGQTKEAALQNGAKIVARAGLEQAPGTVLSEITPYFSGATIAFH